MYNQQIDEVLSEIIRVDWMSDADWVECLALTIDAIGGYEKLNKDISIGVSNGYSIEQQFDIVKKLLKEQA